MNRKFLVVGLITLIGFTACDNAAKDSQKAEETKVSTNVINIPAEDEPIDESKLGAFEFENIVYNFGEITQGEKVQTTFKFKNVGKADLIITDAKGSCGCTVPIYPRNPIAPGETAEIEVVFDSNGKMGQQNKTVTLVANTQPNTTVLALKGDVLTPNK